MKTQISFLLLGSLLALGGCAPWGLNGFLPARCLSDAECGSGQICFPEGCGDPATNVVVEITANTRTGHHAQDLALSSVNASQDLVISGPLSLSGTLTRRASSTALSEKGAAFQEGAVVRLVGQSTLIPGVARQYEASLEPTETGAFTLFVGAGTFTAGATPFDSSIPEVFLPGVIAEPPNDARVTLELPAADEILAVSGRLVKQAHSDPSKDVRLGTTKMQLQAFAPVTGWPLSQPTKLSSDGTGAFTLHLSPLARALASLVIVARPIDAQTNHPSKTFTLAKPLSSPLVLETGDFGALQRNLKGTLRGALGQPVVGATVVLEGTFPDGATYRSRPVTSNEEGVFSVDAFALPSGANYTLVAMPLHRSTAPEPGFLRQSVKLVEKSGVSTLVLEPSEFVCPDRTLFTETVLKPDGTVASGTSVVVKARGTTDKFLASALETTTNDAGQYQIHLDPGEYEVTYLPEDDTLPLRVRLLDVPGASGQPSVDMGTFALSAGQSVSGTISSVDPKGQRRMAANATVRFFRVSYTLLGATSSLLGQTVADEKGRYKVVLPTR